MYEEQLYQSIVSYMEKEGYASYVQIPLFSGKIDFVGVKDSECMVIESKITHWKKALKQALKYGHGAEKVFVALPYPTSKFVMENYKQMFAEYGVGIIDVSMETNVILDCMVKKPSTAFKQMILDEVEYRKIKSQNRLLRFKERLT